MTIEEAMAVAGQIPGWCSDDEFRWLGEQAASRRRIVEIGVWQGRSAKMLALMTPGVVHAVDDFRGAGGARSDGHTGPDGFPLGINSTPRDELEQRFRANLAEEIEAGKLEVTGKASLDAVGEVGEPDMVYIDGNHETDAVIDDIRAWSEVLAPGGLLCGHDAHDERVAAALRDELPGHEIVAGAIWRA